MVAFANEIAVIREPEIMLQRITLNLARTMDHPDGSAGIGYELVAPLDNDGRLDAEGWRTRRKECRVRRSC